MDNKKDNVEVVRKGNIFLEDRKNLSVTGVFEIIAFDEERVVLNTVFKKLEITGQDLKVSKLDIKNGEVNITGKVKGCIYLDDVKDKKSKSKILKKLLGRR